ncbi:DUF6443 domain-containing protein, partial [Geofilum rubicundum]|uniref:DUF6443 domain-containing protein n=1 Tax=Geofilum rubicundum TaxID=472113 RepID=UPI001D0E9736
MKSKLFNALCGFLLISICINAQSPQNGYNYIQSTTLTEPVKDAGAISALSASKKNVTISYYDGLGRPMQSVSWQASPSNRDIV